MYVVDQQEAWGIYGPKIDDPILFSSPEEAFANLVLKPWLWPEDVDFWLHLCANSGNRWRSLGHKVEGLKRPSFIPIGVARYETECLETNFEYVDFWFLLKFAEALDATKYRYLLIGRFPEPKDSSIFSATLLVLSLHLSICRKRDWAKNFLLVWEPDALRFGGVDPINIPSKKRGYFERVSHRDNHFGDPRNYVSL